MKKFLIPAIALLLAVNACKKEDTGQQQQNSCPINQTFVKDISDKLRNGKLIRVQEDDEGNVHAEVNDNGAWLVYQFLPSGNFIRMVTLGAYQFENRLAVKDGYYKTSYTESSIETINSGVILTGWEEIANAYYEQTNTCGRVYTYDTAMVTKPLYTATTSISKLDFNGNVIWTNSYAGYARKEHGLSPVSFDANGDIIMVTIDYKGLQRILQINGGSYEMDDSTRPAFNLTDTISINDKVHGFTLNKISAATGAPVFQTHHMFDHFNKNDELLVCCNVFSAGTWVVLQDQAYVFDLQGNYLNTRNLVDNDCYPKHSVNYTITFFDGNYVFAHGNNVTGGVRASYNEKLDFAGNAMPLNNYYLSTGAIALPSGGFMEANFGDEVRLYSAGGTGSQTFYLKNLVTTKFPNQRFRGHFAFNTFSNLSCNGDLLHVLQGDSSGFGKHWLVRTNSTGGL